MLIRARPGSAAADRALELAREWAKEPDSALLFFHGPGLGHALPTSHSGFGLLGCGHLDLRVCSAGWRRLGVGPVGAPFSEGSLLQFWEVSLRSVSVVSFGALENV
mgnify:CR=1 FL=1